MRCFFGLPMPEAYQSNLAVLINDVKPGLRSRISWTRPDNWHLTLKFLGEVSSEKLESLVGLFQTPLGESFTLQGQGGGFFPDRRRPRVLWVGVGQGMKAVQDLAAEIDRRCATLGFAPESRPFQPHLTVARIRQALDDPWANLLSELRRASWPEIRMERIVLWQSRLTPAGPCYQRLAEFELRPANDPVP
ncbi:2'-5' RNA ligase [Desulfonatronum thiosulfatophilum]|uniref:RNA 2',3'-cyclic phosphodiesterase n=1 Tax=Desulfonatronum thiosulfatophilum TaxID=617002 RepID=A0A1G6B9I5_9BACT|nr:RNA 2',3'-cyclic phosphodiesterase [Desulfonatronum thiosulfatophilum]SDB17287.1 2'-5' RNA ligase [Desulfonatronum thiosulfatophilum]